MQEIFTSKSRQDKQVWVKERPFKGRPSCKMKDLFAHFRSLKATKKFTKSFILDENGTLISD